MLKLYRANIVPLNSTSSKNKRGKMNDNELLTNTVKAVNKMALERVEDNRFYLPIEVAYKPNDNFCRGIALTLSQDDDNFAGHMLKISALHPTKSIELTRPLVYGNKEAILKYLENENVIDLINQDIQAIKEELSST